MMRNTLVRILSGLALAILLPASSAISKETDDHKLSDWNLGEVMFGEQLRRSDLRDKVVVIEYWGVRCPPCIASLPHLAKLDKRYRDKGLRIIGAESQNSSKDNIKPLIEKAKVEYTITRGAQGPIRVSGIPRAFAFDRDGKLIYDGSPFGKDFERTVIKAVRVDPAEPEKKSALPALAGPLIASRVWTNSDGREIRAAVIKADDTTVTFKMQNGRNVSYPIGKLSQKSRDAIAEAVNSE